MNVSGRQVHRQMPVQRNPVTPDKDRTRLAGQPRSGSGHRYSEAGRRRQEFPAVVEQHDTIA
jgi:hypothetical protein